MFSPGDTQPGLKITHYRQVAISKRSWDWTARLRGGPLLSLSNGLSLRQAGRRIYSTGHC